MADSWFDNNMLQRITSANRANTLPKNTNPNLNTNPASTKVYLTLGGTATAQKVFMKPMPPADGSQGPAVDMGMCWFIRYPQNGSPQNYWTVHNARTGANMCLERIDTTKGTLQMTSLTVGKPKPTQMWYITQSSFTTPDNSLFSIIDQPRPDDAPAGGKLPINLDVLAGTDNAAAMRIDGAPAAKGSSKNFTENTVWKVDSVRAMNDADEKGYGWS